jgi:hypothetical protein
MNWTNLGQYSPASVESKHENHLGTKTRPIRRPINEINQNILQTPNSVLLGGRLPCICQNTRAGHDADDNEPRAAEFIEILSEYQYCRLCEQLESIWLAKRRRLGQQLTNLIIRADNQIRAFGVLIVKLGK